MRIVISAPEHLMPAAYEQIEKLQLSLSNKDPAEVKEVKVEITDHGLLTSSYLLGDVRHHF